MSELERDPVLELIIEGVSASAATAWEEARRYGLSIIVWRDGKIVEIPPEKIPSDAPGGRGGV